MAAKLILLFNDEMVGEYALDRESIVIGRRPGSDIQIDNLSVSGAHARVLTILKDSFIEDLGSTNGVFVNGHRIKKQVLADGDLVTIGKHQLRYMRDPNATSDREERVVDPRSLLQQDANRTSSGAARLRLLVEGGSKQLVLSKALTTIGKPGVQVAAISRKPQGDFITHVDGGASDAAVPIVNGTPIGYRSYLLRHQDVIEIAGVRMEYLRS
jgi:hypothetical protein